MAPRLEAESHTVEELAENSSLAELDCVEPARGLVAADPAPLVVANGALHHGAASVLLQLAIAPRTLMVNHLTLDGLIHHRLALQAFLACVQLVGLVLLLTKVTRVGAAFCTFEFVWLFLLVRIFLLMEDCFTIGHRAVYQIFVPGDHGIGLESLVLVKTIDIHNLLNVIHGWGDIASELRAL